MNRFFLTSVLLVGWGCARTPAEGEEVRGRGAQAAVATDAEGRCVEHSVLAAVCPKCNPALEAVFKAKGDWCGEHGFPESFCPICSPALGGQPAVEVAAAPADGAPADGTKVRFKTREAAKLAGIETAIAVEAEREETVSVVARVVYDASKVALISAPASGIVSEIRADVGSRVVRGQALAHIQSATVGAGRSYEEAARARLGAAQVALARQHTLLEVGVNSPREVLAAEQAVVDAKAELASLQSELALVGEGRGGTYTLESPIAGEVTRREVTIGTGVEGGAPLFEVVDATALWAELDVPEADLAHVAVGNAVVMVFDPLPERTFAGTILYIAPTITLDTRTAMARVAVDNTDRALRGNTFGTARIAVTGALPTVVVPASALQTAKGATLVFVRLAEDEYEARRVTVRARSGEEVRLGGGVKSGEVVVTVGSFLLKTETLKDSIGAGCCDVE